MRRIRREDTVKVLRGKSKGQTGKVVGFVKNGAYVVVEGVNLVTKFIKKGWMGEGKAGGIVKVPAPIHASNVMVVCPHCGKTTRVRVKQENGKKWRVCAKCGKLIDKKPVVAKTQKTKKTTRSKVKTTATKKKESKI